MPPTARVAALLSDSDESEKAASSGRIRDPSEGPSIYRNFPSVFDGLLLGPTPTSGVWLQFTRTVSPPAPAGAPGGLRGALTVLTGALVVLHAGVRCIEPRR